MEGQCIETLFFAAHSCYSWNSQTLKPTAESLFKPQNKRYNEENAKVEIED